MIDAVPHQCPSLRRPVAPGDEFGKGGEGCPAQASSIGVMMRLPVAPKMITGQASAGATEMPWTVTAVAAFTVALIALLGAVRGPTTSPSCER